MRENRTHGSEGGEGKSLPDPYQRRRKATFYELINLGSRSFVYVFGIPKDTSGSFDIGFFALAASCLFGLPFTFVLVIYHRLYSKNEPPKVAEGDSMQV